MTDSYRKVVRHFVWQYKDGPASCVVCGGPVLQGDPVAERGTRVRHEWCRFRAGDLEAEPVQPTVIEKMRGPVMLNTGLILYQGMVYDPALIRQSMPWLTDEEVMGYA